MAPGRMPSEKKGSEQEQGEVVTDSQGGHRELGVEQGMGSLCWETP